MLFSFLFQIAIVYLANKLSASEQIRNQTVNCKLTSNPQNSQSAKSLFQNSVSTKRLQKRKEYMKEYMKKKSDNEFKKKESKRKKSYNKKFQNSNPEKIKESWQKATASYRQSNPEKVKESLKAATATYRQSNPAKVKEIFKTANATDRKSNPVKIAELSKMSNIMYKQNYLEKVKDNKKRQYIKRKLDCNESGTKMNKHKKVEDNANENLCEAPQIPANSESRQQINIIKASELFHKYISVGPKIFVHAVTNYGIIQYNQGAADLTKALRSKRREVFFVYLRQLKNRLWCNYGIDHLSLNAKFLYINLVQKKSLISVLLV